ncbi:MAG: RNA polymerase factor sigma-54, partial [Desulfobacterales bacterium]|nr:RNA polymerase factor sigma-54 [Desulfobacterales bacterium]
LEIQQQLKLSQQLVMTPQLQQAIKLLQLNRLELVDMVSQEMEENPALEEVFDNDENKLPDDKNEKKKDENSLQKDEINETVQGDIDWDNYINEYNSVGKVQYETESRESPKYESFISRKESLDDHLLWQLMMMKPTEEEEEIGSIIIGNINQDGYLDITTEEISSLCNSTEHLIESVICRMQKLDPVGVCARSLSECLLIQAKHLNIDDENVINIIKKHIKNLENTNIKAISKDLKISLKEVIKAINIIKEFEPKPGRLFNDDNPQYIIPDIYVHRIEGEYVISLNDDGMPKLRVNPYYKKAVSTGEKISPDTKDYLQDKMRSAAWLIKSIHQRQKTIYNVMQSILAFQKDFFNKGISYLKPMVLRDVAEDIGMHESTISRVTTNKYAFTPQGIFELKYFFNSPIRRVHGSDIASASVMDKIKKIIENENVKKPYSDIKISELLKNENVNIARRTVAKYREILKILPSSKRKQY